MTTKPRTIKAVPAKAGLPAIDRRSLVCGLGTAAVAGDDEGIDLPHRVNLKAARPQEHYVEAAAFFEGSASA